MMSDEERDESELRALFDESAEAPDRMQLVKLKARAQDVPARAGKRFRVRLWAPIFALVAGALAVFAARGAFERTRPDGPVASVISTAPRAPGPETSVARQSTSSSAKPENDDLVTPEDVVALEGETESDTSAELGTIGDDPNDDPIAALDSPADDDIDQWMSATNAYLEGG